MLIKKGFNDTWKVYFTIVTTKKKTFSFFTYLTTLIDFHAPWLEQEKLEFLVLLEKRTRLVQKMQFDLLFRVYGSSDSDINEKPGYVTMKPLTGRAVKHYDSPFVVPIPLSDDIPSYESILAQMIECYSRSFAVYYVDTAFKSFFFCGLVALMQLWSLDPSCLICVWLVGARCWPFLVGERLSGGNYTPESGREMWPFSYQ